MTNKELSIKWAKLYREGNSIRQIAERYQKPISTVYSWLVKRNVEMRQTKNVGGLWQDVPIDKAEELYSTGISMSEVGRLLGFNKGTIRHAFKMHGIKTKKRNNVFTDDEVSKLYLDGYSLENIAKMYSVGRCKIRTSLEKTGTEIRKRSPYDEKLKNETVDYSPYSVGDRKTNFTNSPSKYSNSNQVFTDENFFNQWSHELAYFLGWMATDGNIAETTNSIRITSTDVEHLESIFSLFSYGWTTSMRNWDKEKHPNFNPAGTISITREDIMNKIIDYGIQPNKTFDLKMPYIPNEYMRDFIRGVFEGDGCISFKNEISGAITFSSGSKVFLDELGNAISRQTGLKKYTGQNSDGTYRLVYSSIRGIKELFRYMYEGVPSELILDRKFNRFIELFESRKVAGLDEDNDEHTGEDIS